MSDLNNKSILFISPSFFNYEKAIKNKLSAFGAKVRYFDERPANNFWSKAFIRLNPRLLFFFIDKYYKSIYNIISLETYDYIFVINIEAMPNWFLEKLKDQNPNAKFILYMWDSILNKRNTVNYLSYFDSVFSFDESDCRAYSNIKFRPLFFLDKYRKVADYKSFENHLAFIGTVHSDRFELIRKIKEQIKDKKVNSYWFLYLQNWKLFVWNKINNPSFKKAHFKDFHYKSLNEQAVIDIIRKTRIIVDIHHPKQVGLTIRTIEMLGAQRKLITTNSAIKKYDFYSPDNILVIDRNQPVIPLSFLDTPYQKIPEIILEKYSLDFWINYIFGNE